MGKMYHTFYGKSENWKLFIKKFARRNKTEKYIATGKQNS